MLSVFFLIKDCKFFSHRNNRDSLESLELNVESFKNNHFLARHSWKNLCNLIGLIESDLWSKMVSWRNLSGSQTEYLTKTAIKALRCIPFLQ
jgi:hypothetical protein